MEVVQHIAKLYWFGVDQMRVERTAKLSVGVARQRVRQVDKNSVVVGGHLLGRDEKVKVSAKFRTPAATQTRIHVKISLGGPRCAKCCSTTLLFSNIPLH